MKKYFLAIFVILLSTSTYAVVDSPDVQQGAADYDWESCYNSKSSSCLNGCATSTDINCDENCKEMAHDKCVAEGYTAPQ